MMGRQEQVAGSRNPSKALGLGAWKRTITEQYVYITSMKTILRRKCYFCVKLPVHKALKPSCSREAIENAKNN